MTKPDRRLYSQETRDIKSMSFQLWAIVCDAGLKLKQRLVNVLRLLGFHRGWESMCTRGRVVMVRWLYPPGTSYSPLWFRCLSPGGAWPI